MTKSDKEKDFEDWEYLLKMFYKIYGSAYDDCFSNDGIFILYMIGEKMVKVTTFSNGNVALELTAKGIKAMNEANKKLRQ